MVNLKPKLRKIEKRGPAKKSAKKINPIIESHKRIIDTLYFKLAKPRLSFQTIAAINRYLISIPDELKQHFKVDLILIVHRALSFRETYRDADQRVVQELERNLEQLRSLND